MELTDKLSLYAKPGTGVQWTWYAMEMGHRCTLNPRPMTRDTVGLVHYGTNKLSLNAKPGTGVQWTWYAMEVGHRCTLNPKPRTGT